MSNPLQALKYLPWLALFQVAGLTIAIATGLDLLIVFAALSNDAIAQSLNLLFSPPLGLLVPLVVSGLIGALAVYLTETVFRRIAITIAVLWALVLCLVIVIVVKSWLPIPALLINSSQGSLLGLVVGVFLASANRWRRY